MRYIAVALLTTSILLAAGCSSYTVMFDYDHQEDFSQYKTFDFLPAPQEIQQEREQVQARDRQQ